jgi:cytochrome c556
MFQPKHLLIAIILVGLFIPSVSWADNTDDIIKYRKAVYTSMRGHIGAISRIVRAGLVDYKGHVTDHAAAIQNAAKIIPSMFPEGSDFGETDALESIWTDRAGFEKAAQQLAEASGELVTVSQSGDMKAIGRAVGAVGGACKNCHDNYRASN